MACVRGVPQGYAGTLADAVSPLSNPSLIYTGGHNNGAASGVLKSTDRGKTWVPHCDGLWDTTVASLIIIDEVGDHVLVGTPTGIYETLDGASNWHLMPGSVGIGWARSMKNGTINGEAHIIAGVDAGIAVQKLASHRGFPDKSSTILHNILNRINTRRWGWVWGVSREPCLG